MRSFWLPSIKFDWRIGDHSFLIEKQPFLQESIKPPVFTLFFTDCRLRFVAYGVLNSPQLRGQEPAIEPVTDDAVCDVGLAGRSAVVDASDPNRHIRDRCL